MRIKYVHTNLIAKNWRKLARFYIDVFGCEPQYPERDLSGEWVDQLTNISGVRIRGIHLILPGYAQGPTLEIFEYDPALERNKPCINRQGFGHIAFHVDAVEELACKLVEHGGRIVGQIIRQDYEGIGLLTAFYAEDPEGNFIEVQNWSK